MRRYGIAGLLVTVAVLTVTCAPTWNSAAGQTSGTTQASATPSAGQQAQKSPQPPRPRIRYSIRQSGETDFGPSALIGTFNGKSSVLVPVSKKKCLVIEEQRDFDGDGLTDALVEDITACGGNCCPNRFFFVSARPDGTFAVSDELASSWKDPVIEKWKGKWSVVIVSNNEGANTFRPVEYTRRFILEDGKAVKVYEHKRPDMKAIVEMRSEIFKTDDQGETHSIQFDLDGDGKMDTISGRLWERWGRILWTVEFADGKKFSSDDACKRIGVLPTKTEGVHDLVCDQDTVLHWDGSEYKE